MPFAGSAAVTELWGKCKALFANVTQSGSKYVIHRNGDSTSGPYVGDGVGFVLDGTDAVRVEESTTVAEDTCAAFTLGERSSGGTIGGGSHVLGYDCSASSDYSHAEGLSCTASGYASHAEGEESEASSPNAHAEGLRTSAGGSSSHTEGFRTSTGGDSSHAEGYMTTASGDYSHAQNQGTTARRRSQTVLGEFNKLDTGGSDAASRGKYAVIVGNGTSENARSDALAVDWSGNALIAGEVQDLDGNEKYAHRTNATTSDAGLMSAADKTKLDAVGFRRESDKTTTNYHENNAWGWVASFDLEAGTWLLVGHVQWPTNDTGRRIACIATTNSGSPSTTELRKGAVTASAVSGGNTYVTTSTIVLVTSSTKTYYLRAFQNSGSALSVYGCLQAVRLA